MSDRHGQHKFTRSALGVLIAAVALLVGMVAPASAEEVADSYVVSGEVVADGTLSVTETITFGDGGGPAELVQRLALTRELLNYTRLQYEITDVTVTAGGQDLAPQVTEDGDYLVISVDASKAGADPVVISYQVKGAAVALPAVPEQPELTEVSWRVLQGLNIGVNEVSGVIDLPMGARTNDIACKSGPPTAPASCLTVISGTHDAVFPTFTDGARGPGEMVQLTFSLPSQAVAPNQNIVERWTLDRAFSAEPLPLLAALAALLLGGAALFLLHRKHGADAAGGHPTAIAHFEPVAAGEERFTLVENMRPGEVGTLADERVDPVDITATVVDLAQRGHLTVVELDKEASHAVTDWTFERGTGGDELHDYERTLLDALVPASGEQVRVSQISTVLGPVVGTVQDQIYDEVVKEGWFAVRPDEARDTWGRAGMIAVVVALVALGLLVAFTKFGILGLVLVGLAVGLLSVAGQMARRTAKGASMLKGLEVLAMNLATQPTANVPKDDAYAEISRILPYAIVLGGQDRWLQALVEADNDPGVPDPDDLGWYRAPATWQLSDLPFSVDAFITSMEGRLFARH